MSTSRIALLAAVLLLAGCTRPGVRGITCDTDADCAQGQACSNEVCVGGSGSGSSSGSTSGSSGSSSGSTSGSTGSSSGSTSGSSGSGGSSGSSGSSGSTGGCGPCTAPGDYCDPQRSQCTPAYALAFAAPAPGGWVDGGGSAVQVTAIVAVGSTYAQPARVVLSQGVGSCSADAGDLASDAGSWSGAWRPSPAVDGPQQLCADAFWADGGHLATTSVAVSVDVTPPALAPSLSRQPDDGSDPDSTFPTAFARDEDPLAISAGASDDGGSGVGQVTFELTDLDGGAAPGLTGSVLSLQQPPIADHGTVRVHVTAWDRVLNSASADLDVPITRWKWVVDTHAGAPLLEPASPPGGRIYVAAATSGVDNVFAFEPDGGKVWSTAVADPPSLAPALGRLRRDAIFVAQGSTGKVSVVDLAGGSYTKNVDTSVNALATVDTADSSGTSADAAVLTSSASELLWMVVEDSSQAPLNDDLTPVAESGAAQGLFADSFNIWYGATETTAFVPAYVLRSVPADTSAPGFGTAQTRIGLSEPITVGPVASSQDAYFGSTASAKFRLGHVDLGNSSETPTAATLAASVASEPVIDVGRNAYVATGSTLTQYSPSLTAVPGPSGVAADQGMLLTAGHLYALSGQALTDVSLGASGGSFGTSAWSLSLTGLGTASAPPGLLCGPNGTSAVLVPTAQGKLAAIVIDEPGLAPNAPWPKARRDLLNSANIQTQSPCP